MKFFGLFLIILLIFGCSEKNTEKKFIDKKAIEFNNLAVNQIQNNNYDSALYFIDKAIKIDSNYYLGQYQRLRILWNLNRNEEALKTAKKISELRNYHNVSMEGIACEKLGDLKKAKELYKVTVDNWPQHELDSSFQARIEYAQLGTVVYGKNFGIKELNKIDTTKLNEGETHIVTIMRKMIEQYNGNTYFELMKSLNN